MIIGTAQVIMLIKYTFLERIQPIFTSPKLKRIDERRKKNLPLLIFPRPESKVSHIADGIPTSHMINREKGFAIR